MESHHKAALAKCSLFIKKNITNIREVMDNLLQEDCLTWDERSKIGQEKAIDDQCQILLEILIRRGRNSYNSFISALEDSGNNHVVDEIEKASSKIESLEKKQISVEDLLEEKNRGISDLKRRVAELEGKLKIKKFKLIEVQDQQIKTLEDIKLLKDKANNKDVDIKALECKNREMEREITFLKQRIDYFQKEITLKDGTLKRIEDEKRRLVSDYTRALQNLEWKQDHTNQTCEILSQNVIALTKAIETLQNDFKSRQPNGNGKQPELESPRSPSPKRGIVNPINRGPGPRLGPHKFSIGETIAWKHKKVPKKITKQAEDGS